MASPVYRSNDPAAPVRLVVLGDSTAYTGASGPLLPDEPTLYPNVAARVIEDETGRRVESHVIARPGSGVRDAWYAVTKERHVMFEMLMRADAVIVGVGSFDHAPAGIPPVVESLVPFVRPDSVRRRVRGALRAAHPWGVRLTGGRFPRVPRAEFARLYDGVLHEVRSLTWGAPAVALGPTSHRSPYYGHRHPAHAERAALQRKIAERHRMPFVATWPLVEPWSEKLNVDGIHWPLEAHAAVGEAAGRVLAAQLTGAAPAPGIPGYEDVGEL